MRTIITCSWCGDPHPYDGRAAYCATCQHRADAPRLGCDCRFCRRRRLLTALVTMVDDDRRWLQACAAFADVLTAPAPARTVHVLICGPGLTAAEVAASMLAFASCRGAVSGDTMRPERDELAALVDSPGLAALLRGPAAVAVTNVCDDVYEIREA